MSGYVSVRFGDCRAKLYREGGVGYERCVAGIGWVVDDAPPHWVVDLVHAMQEGMQEQWAGGMAGWWDLHKEFTA